MLNTFRPPTDNLYKFIAIAGLVCFVLGVVLWVRQVQKTLDVAFVSEDVLHETWLVLSDGLTNGDDEAAFHLINKAVEQAKAGEDPFGLTQKAHKLGTLTDEQLDAVRRFEIAVETYADQRQTQSFVEMWLIGLMGGSLATTLGGFGWWYQRTQKYQDQILRIQAGEQVPAEQRSGPANAGRRWTQDEEARLREGFDAKKGDRELRKSTGGPAGPSGRGWRRWGWWRRK
ncbi:MAG: hypothetical protein AAF328_01050 [Planctomycetota bacterium]